MNSIINAAQVICIVRINKCAARFQTV